MSPSFPLVFFFFSYVPLLLFFNRVNGYGVKMPFVFAPDDGACSVEPHRAPAWILSRATVSRCQLQAVVADRVVQYCTRLPHSGSFAWGNLAAISSRHERPRSLLPLG